MKLRKCQDCSRYCLKETCICGGKTATPHPAKFSSSDKYGKYRRLARKS